MLRRPASVIRFCFMPSLRERRLARALPWSTLLVLGCGLVDDAAEQEELGRSWCAEPASADVAEVLVSSHEGVVSSVVLLDAGGEMIAWIQHPDEPELARRFDYVRNSEGRVTEETLDENADGIVEQVTTTIYNDDGTLAGRTVDHDNDGAVDESFVWDYSSPGQVRRVQDMGIDGEADAIQIVTLDGDGVTPRQIDEDTDADGTVDSSTTYSYTDSGQVLEIAIDSDGDRVSDVIVLNQYDEDDRLLRSHQVGDEGAAPSFTEAYEYDADGRLVLVTADVGQDGVIDRMTRLDYDSEGRRVREERTTFEAGDTITSVVEYEYDTGTGARRIRTDDDDDGNWDSLQTRITCAD